MKDWLDDIERASSRAADDPAKAALAQLRTLADYIGQPSLLEPPVAVVPRLAYRARISLLVAPRKMGKSTLVGSMIANATSGELVLGAAPPFPPYVLWICADEPVGDLVRRLRASGARGDVIYIHDGPARISLIAEMATTLDVSLVVIDTVSDVASGEIENENDALQVKRMLAPLRQMAREKGIAVVLLHHANKATGRSRGSGVFEDIADLILHLSTDDGDATVRKVNAEGRVGVEDFRVRWTPEGFELADRELSVLEMVRVAVWGQPGSSTRAIRDKVSKRPAEVQAALARLAALGEVENQGTKQHAAWHLVEARNHPGTTSENHTGTAPEPPGTTPEPAPAPEVGFPPLGGTTPGTASGTALRAAA